MFVAINIFLCWESSVPPSHVYDTTNGWNKPRGPLCFLNSLIGIPKIPMATTCLTFPSQLHWADEGSSSPSETKHLFCRQTPDESDSGYHREQHNTSHTRTSKLQSCFWEQRPSERSAGHLPVPSPSYCFLLKTLFCYLAVRVTVPLPILLASASSDH